MNIYIIDTFAWVEYFQGNKKAEVFRKLLLDTNNQFITAECSVAELRLWSLRARRGFDEFYRVVQANSSLSPITLHDWLEAAGVRQEMRKSRKRFGLIDAILLVKQKELRCQIISGDPHFEGLPGVVFLK